MIWKAVHNRMNKTKQAEPMFKTLSNFCFKNYTYTHTQKHPFIHEKISEKNYALGRRIIMGTKE